ncbi:exodeoxyribonuclease VII small subunit [Phycicoccus flavus]|uniref:exodeoxyribonuclease VII small subunit n=1 Tax=Phycicoccus flavus TaxID=2502783 RepID=UPI000FEB961C|nr:exodeoxyribonuclease VII small subunit [Phycicoccus flavus]NHA69868.1 exodeoxyribonuclease VII small subunit [Phycicoccus flavus]
MPKDPAGPVEGAPDGPADDVADLGYEEARDQLVDIVARLESGQVGLEDSMRLWQRGEALAAHCSTWLDAAEARITADDA